MYVAYGGKVGPWGEGLDERHRIDVVRAEINLKFIRDVVSAIHIGRTGQAFVLDRSGELVAHPDISAARTIQPPPRCARNLPLLPAIFPDQLAPIVRVGPDDERELVMVRWGMPGPPQFGGAPITDIRDRSGTPPNTNRVDLAPNKGCAGCCDDRLGGQYRRSEARIRLFKTRGEVHVIAKSRIVETTT